MLIEPLSVQEQIRTCEVIFVYLPGSIRDLIALTPLLKNLRSTYPNQELVAIGKPNISDILGANQIFDRFLTKPSKSSGLIGYVRFIKQLRQLGSSAGILYRNSISSTMDLVLAGSQVRVGPKNAIYPLLTHCSEPIKKLSCMDQYKLITQKLVTSNGDCLPNLLVDAKSSSICEAVFRKHSLNSDEILVGFNPGSDNGETKKWISDYFGELAHKISDQVGPVRFMVFGGPGNEAQADQICDLIGPRSINLSKECLGLNHVKPFFSRMNLFITNDSGLRWYAAAMQTPTLVLFGPSDPDLNQYFPEDAHAIRKKVHCSPCDYVVCPVGLKCMKELTPDMVLESVKKLLVKGRRMKRSNH